MAAPPAAAAAAYPSPFIESGARTKSQDAILESGLRFGAGQLSELGEPFGPSKVS